MPVACVDKVFPPAPAEHVGAFRGAAGYVDCILHGE
jgi:hypothetical protein